MTTPSTACRVRHLKYKLPPSQNVFFPGIDQMAPKATKQALLAYDVEMPTVCVNGAP